jgi:hypothetical protein
MAVEGRGHTPPPRTHHVSVEQARRVLGDGLGLLGLVGHGGPSVRVHLEARLGLGLHAGGGEGRSHGLGIGHLAVDGVAVDGERDVRVAPLDLARDEGHAAEAARRLAHVHTSLRGPVGGVRVAARLHHLGVDVAAVERAVATLASEQGGEGRGDEVSDLHGECAFCGCAALGMRGL